MINGQYDFLAGCRYVGICAYEPSLCVLSSVIVEVMS